MCADEITHVLFDSYLEVSIKGCERDRRKGEEEGIELDKINDDVAIPTQIEKFWPVNKDKENLQLYAQKLALDKIENLILSSMVVDDEIIDAVHKKGTEIRKVNELNSWDAEADDRVILHVDWAIKSGAWRVVVLSNDSDTLIMLLHFMNRFMNSGSEELWLQYRTGENQRIIPLHLWFVELGVDWCKVLIKVHVLTGNDFLSSIGTKLAAVRLKQI